jgi:hypothetical protein
MVGTIKKTQQPIPYGCRVLEKKLYSRRESNPHFRKNWILNPARLPIPPLEPI